MKRLAVIGLLVWAAQGCECVQLPDGRYRCDETTGDDCEVDAGVDAGHDAGADDGGGTANAGHFDAGACGRQWCWDHPRLNGRTTMRSVFAVSANDVWAVGHAGNAIHWDGQGWEPVHTGTQANLHRVWAARPDSVWMVGHAGTILEWNGQELVRHDAGFAADWRGIAANARRDVQLVGLLGALARYDGQQWVRPVAPNAGHLYVAAAWSDGGAIAMGDNALRFATEQWSLMPKPPNAGAITGLWAPAHDDVWAGGGGGYLAHNATGDLTDAGAWEILDSGSSAPLTSVFALGSHGFWSSTNGLWESTSPVRLASTAIYGIHGLSESDVWAVGPGALLHRTAPGSFPTQTWPGETASVWLQGVAMVPGGGAWAVGDQHAVLTRDGGTWSRLRNDGNVNSGTYHDVWTAAGAPVIAVGGDPIRLAYWDAGAQVMSRINLGFSEELWGVWGSSANDIWAVGQSRRIVHFDGGGWSELPQNPMCGSTDFEEVSGTGPDDVWIVGTNGCVLHWTGSSFTDESMTTPEVLIGVALLPPDQVWVAANAGRIYRRTGAGAWTSEVTSAQRLHDLVAYGGALYAVGDSALVLRRDPGGAWARMVVPAEASLQTITAAPGEGLLTAGQTGSILYTR